jgi:hypothetical protein
LAGTGTNAKLMSQNPSFQFTALREAIKAPVAWFQANRTTARL